MVQLVKLSIPDADDTWYFVTPVPSATMYIPLGHATHGFKAYDVLWGEMAFLKDSWRIDMEGIKPEGLVYKALESAEVKHIPHCLASGDISTNKYHSTKTHMYISQPWAACPSTNHFTPHQHYCLCLDVVGCVLIEYRSLYKMVSAMRDTLIGEFLQCG
jgi:hypothetical protein